MQRVFLSLWVFSFLSSPVWAKDVHLRWEPIEGAVEYEIEIIRNGEAVVRRKIQDSKSEFAAELPSGVYTFRIRAFDWTKQPSEWSKNLPLFSPPPPPKPASPIQKTFETVETEKGIPIKWEKVPGITKYKIEIKKDDKTVVTETVSGHSYLYQQKVLDSYQYRLTSIIELTGDLPQGIEKAVWEGDPGEWVGFRIGVPPVIHSDPLAYPLRGHLQLGPAFSYYGLSVTNKASGGAVNLYSNVNWGAELSGGVQWSPRWDAILRATLIRSRLASATGYQVDTTQQTLLDMEVGPGYHFTRATVRPLVGFSQLPTGQSSSIDQTQISLGPYVSSFFRLGAEASLPVFEESKVRFGLNLRCFAVLGNNAASPNTLGTGYQCGAGVFGEHSLTENWDVRGALAFSHTRLPGLNSIGFDYAKNDFTVGIGVLYRFPESAYTGELK